MFSSGVRQTTRFRIGAAGLALLALGSIGPWQRTILGISANGLDVAWLLLVPALILAGLALYDYDRLREERRRRIGWFFVAASVLVALAEIGNANDPSPDLVVLGWGAIVGGLAAAGLLACGISVLRASALLPPAAARNDPRQARGDEGKPRSAPAGWYADPDVEGGKRYWDGDTWTERRHAPGNEREAGSDP